MSDLWVIPEELGELADSDYAYEACKTASYLLWAMSGRKFSAPGTVTERYDRIPRTESVTVNDWNRGVKGLGTNIPFYSLSFYEGPTAPHTIRLKRANVEQIIAVKYTDGTVVDPATYYLKNSTSVGFSGPFRGSVDITYSFGASIPTAGRMAARALAIEFAKLWEGDSTCQLPERVTSISRQGITATIMDNQDFIQELRTGLYPVDLFLKTVNPAGASNRAKVFSPDVRRGYRRSR